MARTVWALADENLVEHISMNEDPSAKCWLFVMMESLTRDDFARVAVTLWAIWFARRKIIHEGEFQSPLSTHMFIQRYLSELSIVAQESHAPSGRVQRSHPKWIPPSPGRVKLNVDAAVSKTERGGAVAAVCRDEAGNFLGASSLTISGISDPTVLEAMACREALALASDLQVQKATIATDCLAVVNNMNQAYAGSYSMILAEIKEAADRMQEATYVHENRLSNMEAHRLARFSVSNGFGRQVWLLQPPDGLCIQNNVLDQ
jgi:ribonuclease HI